MRKIKLAISSLDKTPDKKELALRLGFIEGNFIWFTDEALRQISPNHPVLKRNSAQPIQKLVSRSPETEAAYKAICENCPSGVYSEPQQKCAHPKCEVCSKSPKRAMPWKTLSRCAGGHW